MRALSYDKVTFSKASPDGFSKEVKERVNEYFRVSKLSKKADRRMVFKAITLFGLTYGSYGLVLFGHFTHLQMVPLCFLMGIGMAGIGFCISHDALHGAFSSNKTINAILGFSFELIGANGYIWKIAHNCIHHTYTNIHGHDEDLVVAGFIRLSPRAEYRPIHSVQHVLAFFSYSLSTLFWVFIKDYKYFLKSDLGPYRSKRHPKTQILSLIVTKVLYYAYTIALPIWWLQLTLGQFLIGYVIVHLTAGLILGVVFQLAHIVEETQFPEVGADGDLQNTWAVHQLGTTCDFAKNNRLLSWYVGGLNFQIEHHLFPDVCSIHYPNISPIVERVALAHGVPYHSHATLREAISSHYRTLKKFGDSRLAPVTEGA